MWHTKATDLKPQTYEPVLTVYVAGDQQQQHLHEIDWADNIVIENEVADWELTSKARQPFRKQLHAVVYFEDGKPK